MDRIRQLEGEANERRTKVGAILRRAEGEKRNLTDDERAEADRETAALGACEAQLAAEYKRDNWERTSAPAIDRHGAPLQQERPAGTPGLAAKYRDLFGAPAASDFDTDGSFFQAVASGRHHPALRPAAAMGGSTGSAGGFLVPEELSALAFDESIESEVVRPRARVFPMISDTRKIGGFQADGSASTGPYGFIPSWTAEGVTIPAVNPLVRLVTLAAKKLGIFVQASNELVADGLGFDAQLTGVLTNAINWSLDYSFLVGTGAGQPLGVINAPCTVEVAKEGGQSAASVVSTNVLRMYARLLPGSFKRAVWVVSPTVKPQLYSLSIPVGTGGVSYSQTPLLTVDQGRMTLLGLPVVESEKMPALGSRGDVLLADFSFYAVGLRKEVTIDRSAHVGFQADLESFRGTLRADGCPLLATAYTPKNGDSLSPFVVLGARA